jgi:hypothetical protein
MKAIDDDTVLALKRAAPEWIKAVQHAKEEEADVILTLDAFVGDPQLLFDALWFAHDRGVAVMLAPPSEKR